MTRINVDAKGLSELAGQLAGAGARLDRAMEQITEEAADIVASEIRVLAPRRTGQLVDSIEASPVDGGWAVQPVARAEDGYAYPGKVNQDQRFMERAAEAAEPRIRELAAERIQDAVQAVD